MQVRYDVQKLNSQLAEPSLQLELLDVAHLLLLVPAQWDEETGEELQLVGLIFRERRLRIVWYAGLWQSSFSSSV